MGRAGLVLRVASCALIAAMLAAIAVQALTLPLGLFNDGRGLYRAGTALCVAALVGALAVLLLELATGRARAAAGAVRGTLFSLLLVEALLTVVDARLLSHPEARIGGPYWEARVPGHGGVPLKKPSPVSPFGFRWDAPLPRESETPRVLFLGDSYVEGSGRSLACNYPEVAAETLGQALGRPVQALNAGVAGAGPVEALGAFRLLRAEGYRFDAVVHTLFLENDFSDDLPGTRRHVVAGMSFRFPESAWLRRLHPMNATSVRTAMFLARASRLVRDAPAAARRDPGRCRLAPEPLGDVPQELRELVLRRLEDNYGPHPRVAEDTVRQALRTLRAEVAALGVPLFVAVLPDRILADAELRAALGVSLDDYQARRLTDFAAGLEGFEVIDLSAAVAGSESYRPDDTHLSDLGNVRAGQALGRALAPALAPALGDALSAAEPRD